MLTNTNVKASRMLNLPLYTALPDPHHSIGSVFHPAHLDLDHGEVAVPLACAAVSLILTPYLRDVEQDKLVAGACASGDGAAKWTT